MPGNITRHRPENTGLLTTAAVLGARITSPALAPAFPIGVVRPAMET